MTVLTVVDAEISRFVEALDAEGLAGIVDSDVSATDTTIADFTVRWGEADQRDAENGVEIMCWFDRQTGKGKRRGDLYVAAVAGGTVSYFSGGE